MDVDVGHKMEVYMKFMKFMYIEFIEEMRRKLIDGTGEML